MRLMQTGEFATAAHSQFGRAEENFSLNLMVGYLRVNDFHSGLSLLWTIDFN